MPHTPHNPAANESEDPFPFDVERRDAGAGLNPQHHDDFQRMVKRIRFGGGFRLLVAVYGDSAYRDRVIAGVDAALAACGIRSEHLWLESGDPEDGPALAERLRHLPSVETAVHIVEREGVAWFSAPRWAALNVRREQISAGARAALVLWLHPDAVRDMAVKARDLWSWRSGVYDFHAAPLPEDRPLSPDHRPFDARPMAERARRAAEIRNHLQASPGPTGEIRASLAVEMADLLESMGKRDQAERVLRDIALPEFRRIGDARSHAVSMGRIADILQARGERDAALKIWREAVLPVFGRLGDVRAQAVTMGRIADILESCGERDDALKIWQQDLLPIFERIGDVRSRAVTMGKIADILRDRGELDAALKILREEELPVYERLGDVRSHAGAMGRVADILQARGEVDAALKTRREEVLPVFGRLGDVRERAVTLGKIADTLRARGELDAALKIQQEELLPALERLGEERMLVVCRTNVAIDLARRVYEGEAWTAQDLADLREAERLLGLAHADAVRLRLPEADQVAMWQGRLAEAFALARSAG